ncbi:hypothetical protein [Streptomyces sediminimaris]|uniref:hypothetical protein n=1 Tax=Streptomyces sediminimaris TaxID=3383721 RepID=UPI00399AFED0
MTGRGRDAATYERRGATESDRGFLAEVDRHQPELVREERYTETWQRGPLTLILPPVREWYPPELKAATQLGRQSAMDGHCTACGAYSRATDGEWYMKHEDTCMATDDALDMLINEATLKMFPADDPDGPPPGLLD